jgi:uncharacterized protein YbjT (DUF2867 family)
MILITGATGNNGLEVLKRLSAGNVQVRGMVRDRDRASASDRCQTSNCSCCLRDAIAKGNFIVQSACNIRF